MGQYKNLMIEICETYAKQHGIDDDSLMDAVIAEDEIGEYGEHVKNVLKLLHDDSPTCANDVNLCNLKLDGVVWGCQFYECSNCGREHLIEIVGTCSCGGKLFAQQWQDVIWSECVKCGAKWDEQIV